MRAKAKHPDIPMVPVKSEQLAAIGHDPAREVLAVRFKRGGAVYHYSGVTKQLHAAFVAADSKGAFFARHIRPLTATKVEEPPKVQHLPADDTEGGAL